MPSSQEIIEQVQKWINNNQFLEHTAYEISDLAEMFDTDENIQGVITARAKAPEPYSGFAAGWVVFLTNKRLMFLSKGDEGSLYVDSVVSKWEIPLDRILSAKKRSWFLSNNIILYPSECVIKRIPNSTIDPFFEALTDAIKHCKK